MNVNLEFTNLSKGHLDFLSEASWFYLSHLDRDVALVPSNADFLPMVLNYFSDHIDGSLKDDTLPAELREKLENIDKLRLDLIASIRDYVADWEETF